MTLLALTTRDTRVLLRLLDHYQRYLKSEAEAHEVPGAERRPALVLESKRRWRAAEEFKIRLEAGK
jgi:hypothetical protein